VIRLKRTARNMKNINEELMLIIKFRGILDHGCIKQ
jgi:hypothetical protein